MDKNLTHGILILGIIAIITLIAIQDTPTVNVGPEAQLDTLSVSGNAKLTVDPDKADIYVSIVTEELTADAAQDANAVISNTVIAALKAEGVSEDDLETTSFNLRKKQEWEDRKLVDKGYEVTHTLKIYTEDLENVGKLADTAVKAGANRISSINFGLTKATEEDVRSQALKNAADAAKDKAESIATATGVSLVKITKITESNFNYRSYDYAPKMAADFAVEESIETEILPEDIDVTASMSLTYEIKN